jgi:glycosyl transferase family 25
MASESSFQIGNLTVHDSVCISLDTQTEARKQVITECAKLGFRPKFHTPKRNTDPVQGCLESHIYCIEYAKRNNLENILILEDDVIFEEDSLKLFEKTVFPTEYNTVYLGYHGLSGYRVNSEKYIKLTSSLTTHAYIVHSSMFDYILNNINEDWYSISEMTDLTPAEAPFFESRLHAIDVFYAKWICHRLDNSFALYPMIAYQRPGYSEIENQTVDYTDLFKFRANILGSKTMCNYIKSITIADFSQINTLMKHQSLGNRYDFSLVYTEPNKDYVNEYLAQLEKSQIYTPDSWDILWLIEKGMALVRNTVKICPSDLRVHSSVYPYINGVSPTVYNKMSTPEQKILVVWTGTTRTTTEFINEHIQDTAGYIVHIIKQDTIKYRCIPPHELIIIDDLDFFNKEQCNATKVTLFMTSGALPSSIPFGGENFLYNLQDTINNVIFRNMTDLKEFKKRYNITTSTKLKIKKSNAGYHQKNKNSVYCSKDDPNYPEFIEWFNTLLPSVPGLSMTVFDSSEKNLHKNITHINTPAKNTPQYEFCFCTTESEYVKQSLLEGCITIGYAPRCSLMATIPDFVPQLSAFMNISINDTLSERIFQVYNEIKFC